MRDTGRFAPECPIEAAVGSPKHPQWDKEDSTPNEGSCQQQSQQGARTTPETPKQKDPQRVETTRVVPVETTEAAEAVATTE